MESKLRYFFEISLVCSLMLSVTINNKVFTFILFTDVKKELPNKTEWMFCIRDFLSSNKLPKNVFALVQNVLFM